MPRPPNADKPGSYVPCNYCDKPLHWKGVSKHRINHCPKNPNSVKNTKTNSKRPRKRASNNTPDNTSVPTLSESTPEVTPAAQSSAASTTPCDCCHQDIEADLWTLHHAVCVINNYKRQAAEALEKGASMIVGGKMKFPKNSWGRKQYQYFELIITKADIGEALTPAEYCSKQRHELNNRNFVVCATVEEALVVILHGRIVIPILILNSSSSSLLQAQAAHTVNKYLQNLISNKGMVDLHVFNKKLEKDGTSKVERLLTTKAIEIFMDPKKTTNMLNLRCCRANPIPDAMAAMNSMQAIPHLTDRLANGKNMQVKIPEVKAPPPPRWKSRQAKNAAEEPVQRVLSLDLLEISQSFSLLANMGAIHQPHVDRCGVITCIRCEQGAKLWITWILLTAEEWRKWLDEGTLTLRPGTAIYIPQGATLIQPAQTLHAPLSLSDVLMSGTMHWDERDIAPAFRGTQMDLEVRNSTNEDCPVDVYEMLELVLELWEEEVVRGDAEPLKWGSAEELAECKALFAVRVIVFLAIGPLMTY